MYVGSDLGAGTLDEMRRRLPGQFLMEGISEAYLIGMAAGLSMTGKKPFVNTIATFLTRRCYDQIAVDVCMGNHDVRLVSNGGGVVYAPLGPTHLATDDIALMRALPNMTVIVPADADEMDRAIRASVGHRGPIYYRLARGGDPLVPQEASGFKIGKAILLRPPRDLVIVACGIMVHRALLVAEKLETEGIQAGVINMHTVKPLDQEILTRYFSKIPKIMTLEEHSLVGGLGSAVAEVIASAELQAPVQLKMMGIPDCFPDKYGRQDDLLEYFGLDVISIYNIAKQMVAKSAKCSK